VENRGIQISRILKCLTSWKRKLRLWKRPVAAFRDLRLRIRKDLLWLEDWNSDGTRLHTKAAFVEFFERVDVKPFLLIIKNWVAWKTMMMVARPQ
jgi:hypothetical protein